MTFIPENEGTFNIQMVWCAVVIIMMIYSSEGEEVGIRLNINGNAKS